MARALVYAGDRGTRSADRETSEGEEEEEGRRSRAAATRQTQQHLLRARVDGGCRCYHAIQRMRRHQPLVAANESR